VGMGKEIEEKTEEVSFFLQTKTPGSGGAGNPGDRKQRRDQKEEKGHLGHEFIACRNKKKKKTLHWKFPGKGRNDLGGMGTGGDGWENFGFFCWGNSPGQGGGLMELFASGGQKRLNGRGVVRRGFLYGEFLREKGKFELPGGGD